MELYLSFSLMFRFGIQFRAIQLRAFWCLPSESTSPSPEGGEAPQHSTIVGKDQPAYCRSRMPWLQWIYYSPSAVSSKTQIRRMRESVALYSWLHRIYRLEIALFLAIAMAPESILDFMPIPKPCQKQIEFSVIQIQLTEIHIPLWG